MAKYPGMHWVSVVGRKQHGFGFGVAGIFFVMK